MFAVLRRVPKVSPICPELCRRSATGARIRPCAAGWSPEPGEVADRRGDRHRGRDVDTGDRHQPLGVRAAQRDLRELGVDEPQRLAVEVQLAQQRPGGLALVGRQLLLGQPAAIRDPEQVGDGAAR
jgi:hypothetical protein